jgi:hypothetical protein
MNRRKQFRAVATRFDKLAVRYQATVCVADIFIWLRARPDRARGDPRNTPLGPGRPRSWHCAGWWPPHGWSCCWRPDRRWRSGC